MDCLPLLRAVKGRRSSHSHIDNGKPAWGCKGLLKKRSMMATRLSLSGQLRAEARWGIVLALPAIIGFVVWVAGPIVASFVFSFSDWNVGGRFRFVGLENYVRMAQSDKLFWKSLPVTTYYSLTSIPLTLFFAFAIAVLLNQRVIGISFFRTLLYLPSVAPTVAVAMLWLWLFNPDFGLLNYLLRVIGLPKLLWIHDETQVIPSFVLMSIWRIGGPMVIFLAALQGIPASLYEAAELDGGGWWSKLRFITLPLATPAFFFNAVMGIISSFQIFNEAYIMTDGGPNNASLFLVYYVYLNAFRYGRMGYASSLAWALFIVILILTLLMFRVSRNWVYYEAKGR